MSRMDQPNVTLSVVSEYSSVSFSDVEEAFGGDATHLALTFRPPEGAYASFEWLIPAGAILIYSTAFLQELGSKHAAAINDAFGAGLKKLWSKAFGAKREITSEIRDSNGNVKGEPFSAAFETKTSTNDGRPICLRYRTDISEDQFVRATVAFLELMSRHHSQPAADPLKDAVAGTSHFISESRWALVVHHNDATGNLEVIDYVQTSMHRRFVAVPIRTKH
jgi:hypothetical protein